MEHPARASADARASLRVRVAAVLAVAAFAIGAAIVLLNLGGPRPSVVPAPSTASSAPTASATVAPPSSPAASATFAAPSPSPGGEGPPPLNRLELKVIDALARLGITGQRAEFPFNNAAIWAQLGTASQLFVNAAPTGTSRGEFTVMDERQLAGIRVLRVQYASGPPPRHRFDCMGDTYEVRGALPSGFADMDAFVGRFIGALGCGS